MITLSCNASSVYAQLKTHLFTQIDSLQKLDNKNVLVFIYTDWCRYCNIMKNTTFKNENVIKLLNDKFWFVSLNAEEKQGIDFNKNLFKYKPTGNKTGVHELAEQLGTFDGKLSYPALCMLNSGYEIVFQYGGFLSVAELLKVLKAAEK